MEPPRRFEFAMIENIFDEALVLETLRRPQSWKELGPDRRLDTTLERWTESQPPTVDEPHGDDFHLFVDGDFLCCRPEEKFQRCEIWIYSVRAEDPAVPPHLQGGACDEARKVAVREVPPTFIVTCGVSQISRHRFHAKFTTLSGELMSQFMCPPMSVTAPALTRKACHEAASQGRLRSCNQEVCLLLDGELEPLGTERVPDLFWS